jgi:hypothetical protein
MKNQILKSTAVTVVLLSLIAGAGSVFAQNSSAGAALQMRAEPTLAVPAGYTVIPPDDVDRSDDQIVQLENLTIQKISGTVPGLIYASRDIGGPCREFMDVEGRSGSKIYPCPLAPTVLYQISVESDTILLLKNRTRANISDFVAGDHINVFGFLDRGTSGVQALIIRNLDKPATDARYVQLNNLTVVSEPTSLTPPATFRAARKGIEPCLNFTAAAPRGATIACPLGVEISVDPKILSSDDGLYRPFRQYYNIQVTASTRLLNLNRKPMALSDIQVGDQVNVYGRYIPGTRMVEALIVRDLSVPRSGTSQASLVVNVTDVGITCITTPCGQVNGATVDVHWLDFEGDDTPQLVASQVTVNGQAGFRNLKPGLYVVTVSGEGFSSVGQRITLRSGQTGKINLFVGKEDDNSREPHILSISPRRGLPGTQITLRGNFAKTGNYVYFGDYNAGNDLSSDGTKLVFSVPTYVSPCTFDRFDAQKSDQMCAMIALEIPPGEYAVYVKNPDGSSNTVTFEVTPSPTLQ